MPKKRKTKRNPPPGHPAFGTAKDPRFKRVVAAWTISGGSGRWPNTYYKCWKFADASWPGETTKSAGVMACGFIDYDDRGYVAWDTGPYGFMGDTDLGKLARAAVKRWERTHQTVVGKDDVPKRKRAAKKATKKKAKKNAARGLGIKGLVKEFAKLGIRTSDAAVKELISTYRDADDGDQVRFSGPRPYGYFRGRGGGSTRLVANGKPEIHFNVQSWHKLTATDVRRMIASDLDDLIESNPCGRKKKRKAKKNPHKAPAYGSAGYVARRIIDAHKRQRAGWVDRLSDAYVDGAEGEAERYQRATRLFNEVKKRGWILEAGRLTRARKGAKDPVQVVPRPRSLRSPVNPKKGRGAGFKARVRELASVGGKAAGKVASGAASGVIAGIVVAASRTPNPSKRMASSLNPKNVKRIAKL